LADARNNAVNAIRSAAAPRAARRAGRGKWARAAFVAVLAMCFGAPAADAQIKARVGSVGLTANQHKLREGSFGAVTVILTNSGGGIFEGSLQIQQEDRDRDVVVATTPVILDAGQSRPYTVYLIPGSLQNMSRLHIRLHDQNDVLVKLIDEQGAPQSEIMSGPVEMMRAGDLMVVENVVPGERPLIFPEHFLSNDLHTLPEGMAIHVIHPDNEAAFPDRRQGLEFADALVFNDVDFSRYEPARLRAIVAWVRHGGRLLISTGRNWMTINGTPLDEIMPVRLTGTKAITRRAAWTCIVQWTVGEDDTALDQSIMRCTTARRGGDLGSLSLPTNLDDALEPMIWRNFVGRGEVTLVTCSLTDLLRIVRPAPVAAGTEGDDDADHGSAALPMSIGGVDRKQVLRRLFPMLLSIPPLPREGSNATSFGTFADPFQTASGPVTFQQTAGQHLLFAMFFCFVYSAAASVASYLWLRSRNWLHHAWSAFAGVAVLGCVLGVLAVWSLRPFSRLHDVQIVDGWANQPAVYATALFGLNSATHRTADVRLPTARIGTESDEDFGPLTVIPPLPFDRNDARGFVAPRRYEHTLDGTRVDDVVIRATLKEFMGSWEGALVDGQLEADLVMRRGGSGRMRRLVEPSYVRNNLGVDLEYCFLLETDDDSVEDNTRVYCHGLGDLKQGEGVRQFDYLYYRSDENKPDDPPMLIGLADMPRLDKVAGMWPLSSTLAPWPGWGGRGAFRMSAEQRGLMWLSMIRTYNPDLASGGGYRPVRISNGHSIDCLHMLSQRTAIFIGFSHKPGPARLEIDGSIMNPSESLTMYRFVIPISKILQPLPEEPTGPEDDVAP
jgi:hypothetical protein